VNAVPTALPASNAPDVRTYAPEFAVFVGGTEIAESIKEDILSVKIDMDLDNLDHFDLVVSNWDDRAIDYKYSDKKIFDVDTPVTVQLGYAGHLVTVMHGFVEALAPKFPEGESPTLTLSGASSLKKLRGRRPGPNDQKLYENLADWEIAHRIARRNDLDAVVTQQGEKNEVLWQRDLDDAQFLMERARKIDFDVYVQYDEGSRRDVLHFEKPHDLRDSTRSRIFTFDYAVGPPPQGAQLPDRHLREFTPKLNTTRQVGSITVRGWDPQRKEAITATATRQSLPGSAGPGKSGVDFAGPKADEVLDTPVASQREAQSLADARLRERAYDFLTGDGRVVGLPELRPGVNVQLRGLGVRFSGTYYVKTVSHQLGAAGYSTSFGVRRVFDGGLE
jgi:phage protein D